MRICLNCDVPIPENASKRKKFCSKRCAAHHRWINGEGKERAERRSNRICEYCDIQFDANKENQVFCSEKCQKRQNNINDPDYLIKARQRSRDRRAKFPREGLSYRHGRNFDELVAELADQQDSKCYLCGILLDLTITLGSHGGQRGFAIDHDYRCCPYGKTCVKCRRGLACHPCNLAIGQLNDDPDRMRRMADALEKAKEEVKKRLAPYPLK